MEKWYTLYTKPNAEYQVTTTLAQRGFPTYFPELIDSKTPSTSKKKAFFPCYIFVKADFNVVGLREVQWVPGLRRIVSFNEHPIAVGDEIIELIRHKMDDQQPDTPAFQPGDTVQITNGPFQNLLATIEATSPPKERVQVLLNILGASRVQVDINDLEKVLPEGEALKVKRRRGTRGRGRRIKN